MWSAAAFAVVLALQELHSAFAVVLALRELHSAFAVVESCILLLLLF